ncbi:putative SprT family Zn-dependent metalloprotease [Nocardioides massiliensis]|uniref:SprT family Zn-dependent metalloprotease n=2 Tax=Nocardioides massiliensis TaxID=1325935 RepID=A0ABT9NKW9_9ACTN|nr:SprT-like domain-containing protein [Nocardioides massiliensis]MDP9821063.1 putative SprT family Zn-dependent metalloprotease [Nocardioides massiliensis]
MSTTVKFHLAKDGPAPCNATKRACPLGGEHFDTEEEAFDAYDAAAASDQQVQPMGEAEARALTKQLLAEHGLADVKVKFTNSTNSLGKCVFRQVRRFGSIHFETIPYAIHLSRRWLQHGSREQAEDTIRHEVAHAVAGSLAGHGPAWKEVARRLGATPEACATATAEEREAAHPYKIQCEGCGDKHLFGSAPRSVRSCGRCSTKSGFDPTTMFTLYKEGQPVELDAMPRSYRGSYLFVQEKYADEIAVANAERLGVEPDEAGFATNPVTNTCHYFGSTKALRNNEDEPQREKKPAKELDPAIIEALKLKYLKKFKVPFDESGLSVPELLQMAQKGELD